MQTPTPPSFPRISRTIDDIRASIYARIDAVQDAFAAKGWLPRRLNLNKGVVRGCIEIYAWGAWQIYNLLEKLLKQILPQFSEDEWLDLHLESVGLTRKEATKATGNVRFYRNASAGGNIVIQSGRIVKTEPDGKGDVYRYITTEKAVLPAGEEFVDVPVVAEEYGAGANAGAGQICELVTAVPGIGSVSNTADWLTSEGADKESNALAYERYRLCWLANNGCTKYAYKLWALSVPGVLSVEILDQHPQGQGTVGVVVRGSAVLPTEALLERVREAVAAKAPINDEWYVVGPEPVATAILGRLHYVVGLGDPDLLISEAKKRIHALFAETSPYTEITPLAIGQDLPLDLLTATVMSIPGVKSVDWLTPSADVVVPKDGIAMLESVDFMTLAEDEA
ncbi:MAG: hypothetical protein DELT_02984 [Desulfovibrio sp.]